MAIYAINTTVSTAVNVQSEVSIAATHLPLGRKLIVGLYATGHSHLGTPAAEYVRILPELAFTAHPDVIGVMSFTMLAPCGPRVHDGDGSCVGDGGHPSWMIDLCAKGCAQTTLPSLPAGSADCLLFSACRQ